MNYLIVKREPKSEECKEKIRRNPRTKNAATLAEMNYTPLGSMSFSPQELEDLGGVYERIAEVYGEGDYELRYCSGKKGNPRALVIGRPQGYEF